MNISRTAVQTKGTMMLLLYRRLLHVFLVLFIVNHIQFSFGYTANWLAMSKSVGILWDVDGTLSDSYKLGFDSTNAVLNKNGRESISSESYHQGTKFTTPRRMAWHVTGDPDNPIGEELGQQFDQLYVDLVSSATAPFYEGIHNLLKSVRDSHGFVRYGALSNACGAYVRAVLKANNVDDLFEIQLGADEVPAAKPEPDGLLQLSREMGNIDPSRCIYIGDSPTDGLAASAAGMLGIGVTWGSHPAESVKKGFSIIVHTVDELQAAILDTLKQL